MKLGFLLLSDHSESVNGKIYALGAGWNQLRFPELPQEFNFSIALGLDVPWDETNRQHTMTLHVEDPDGERLGDEFSLDFEAGRPPGSVAGQEQRIVLSLGARTVFSASGPHAVVVGVGGDEIDRARFYVMQSPPEALPGQMQTDV
jgi:Family of unknown function (DUF6941)